MRTSNFGAERFQFPNHSKVRKSDGLGCFSKQKIEWQQDSATDTEVAVELSLTIAAEIFIELWNVNSHNLLYRRISSAGS